MRSCKDIDWGLKQVGADTNGERPEQAVQAGKSGMPSRLLKSDVAHGSTSSP